MLQSCKAMGERSVLIKRLGSSESQAKDVTRVFCTIVLGRVKTLYLLDAASTFRLQLLCTAAKHDVDPRKFFLHGLKRNEPGRGCIDRRSIPLDSLYRDYHGALLQRSFLRRLVPHTGPQSHALKSRSGASGVNSVVERGPVLAGSYPLALLTKYQSASGCIWRPNDIDIFVTSPDSMRKFAKLYREMVIEPLKLTHKVEEHNTYADDVEESDITFLPAHLHRTHFDVCRSIKQWLGEDLFCWEGSGNFVAPQEERERIRTELRSIVEHVPMCFSNPTYQIVKCLKLRPRSCRHRGTDLPSTLMPINLIRVYLDPAMDHLDFASVLVSNFDLLNCQVTATVTEDLSFEIHCTDAVRGLNREGHLHFSSNSFASRDGNVHRNLERVRKYIWRGFGWPAKERVL